MADDTVESDGTELSEDATGESDSLLQAALHSTKVEHVHPDSRRAAWEGRRRPGPPAMQVSVMRLVMPQPAQLITEAAPA